MKYNNLKQNIPQNKRKEINDKILYCIDNRLCSNFNLSQEIIYNSYTGDGGLHDLNFKDFNSFHDFTKAKQDIENGQFFTPHDTLKFMIDVLKIKEDKTILDLSCGSGNVFNFISNEFNCYGCEIDRKSYKIAKYLYPNANIECCDMREYNPHIIFDYVIGNPPYNLDMYYRGSRKKSQIVFIEKSLQLLKNGGIMAIIVPKSFLNDDFSNKSDITFMNENFNFVGQIKLKNDTFRNVGVENFETKIVIFQKKSQYIESKEYKNEFIEDTEPDIIYNKYIKPLYDNLQVNKGKITLENNNKTDIEIDDTDFKFKVDKLLFDVKRNKSIKNKYNKCISYYQTYLNQQKPKDMNYKDWEEIRITKEKVINYLKQILSSQHIKEKDKIQLVKTNYGLKLKGYSEANKKYIKTLKSNFMSFNNMIINNNYPFKDKKYYKLCIKKKEQFKKQSVNFEDMKEDIHIKNWLDSLIIKDYENNEDIRLNNVQKEIVNKILQKEYGYIQAEQGSGKTLMSIVYSLYRKQYTDIKNVFIVAPSIAINGTWNTTLENYKIPFTVLKNISDIKSINKDDFVLVTFNMLMKLQKHIKKYLKSISNNYELIIDECDSICRIDSKRSKSTINVFHKAKYKLCLSGTMIRNNITEAFTQFNLLYNSSINFLSKNEYIFKEEKSLENEKILVKTTNPYYFKPFPQYKKGHNLFSQSFNPQKVTVFGVGQNTQNIYNSDVLKELMNKTIITKTFEEIVGRKIYEIIQHTVKFNGSEKCLYDKAINEFYSMKYLFTSTGNPRKDRMMEIIQQITLLLNICQHPQTYKEYSHLEIPNKYLKVMNLLKKWNNEQVAIGCRSLKEIDCYNALISSYFPDRKLYVVTGSVSMEDRKEIIKQLKNNKNGILLSTQQSLSSSISIDYVNKAIITALSWNFSSLSQYFFRFIRYSSKNDKEIHFITYENSLESNLLGLLLAKENLTMFLKNKDVDNDELYEKFGIDFNLIDMLLCKEKDSEGHTRIVNWGNQEIN